ncbi:MAG: hypothetical protein K9J37_19650 [Saprospiraceae bacterium]|nr:hypothetical protein [Saprospiraceae bacterium]MCF8252141.1 hypothetical protein [Saprospiraceae bacterium]MCF8282450.1 hypothetical protein [Bacteroidales bacterium]MCF8313810.1 hypothetical protein [Saprospiraceae bacterium]MCF8442516.1 hypothetical protein [Saprospiraceae bacterium]
MKKHFFQQAVLLTGFVLAFFVQNAKAQIVIGGNYRFLSNIPQNDNYQLTETGTPVEVVKGKKINVLDVDIEENLVSYTYWESLADGVTSDEVLQMTLEKFERLTEPIYRVFKGFSAGAYTIPVRLRGIGKKSNFDFESSLSLSANFVVGWGCKDTPESFIDLALGVGLTSVVLTKNNSEITEDQRTAAAFTASLGVLVKPKPYVNIGLFWGGDWLGNPDKDTVKWKYNSKAWLGLGVNVFFNVTKSEENTAEPKF